jgi:hypothetical protein
VDIKLYYHQQLVQDMALKRIILFLSLVSSSAWATIWTPADGKLSTIQAIIDNTTPPILAAGDRIVIPDSAGEPSGMWEWGTGTLRINKGFQIELYGADGTIAHRPTIHGDTGCPQMVWYTCGDPLPRKTGLIYNIEFYGEAGVDKLRIDGVNTYTVSGTTVTGGLRIGYCRFSSPYYTGNGRTITGCSAPSGSTALTCTGGNFTAADVSRVIYIPRRQFQAATTDTPYSVRGLYPHDAENGNKGSYH